MTVAIRTVARLALVLWLLPVLATGVSAGDRADIQFEQGIQAFDAGHYEQALAAFEEARRLGLDTWQLRYHLGAACYELRRYPQARREFESLLDTAAIADRARYDLGLVSRQQGLDDEAYGHFRRVVEAATDPALKQLAENQLALFPSLAPVRRLRGFLDAGGGYDDNVTLVPDPAIVAQSGEGDSFIELMGGLVGQLTGTSDGGVRAKASVYWIDYSDLDAFDQLALHGGIAWRERIGGWLSELAGYADLVYLGAQPFERIGTLSLQGDRELDLDTVLRLRVRSGYVDASGDYSALTGWRNQLLAELRGDGETGDWRLGYELEINNRRDVASGAESASVSPLQQTLFAGFDWRLRDDAVLALDAGYRSSRYPDADGGQQHGGATQQREDRSWETGAELEYYLTGAWTVSAGYRYSQNDSNQDEYDYTSRRISARLERLF